VSGLKGGLDVIGAIQEVVNVLHEVVVLVTRLQFDLIGNINLVLAVLVLEQVVEHFQRLVRIPRLGGRHGGHGIGGAGLVLGLELDGISGAAHEGGLLVGLRVEAGVRSAARAGGHRLERVVALASIAKPGKKYS